jgi:hypothetical protein
VARFARKRKRASSPGSGFRDDATIPSKESRARFCQSVLEQT